MASGSLAIQPVLPPEQKADPSPCDDHGPHRPVGRELVDRGDPRCGHLVGHRVAHVGVVEDEKGDARGGAFEAQMGELWHGPNPTEGATGLAVTGFTASRLTGARSGVPPTPEPPRDVGSESF